MRLTAFVLILLAVPAAFAGADPWAQGEGAARQVLDSCIETLQPDVMGLDDIEAACPGLTAAFDQLGIANLLPERKDYLLTRNGLINLRTLMDRYAQPPERRLLEAASLDSILESLREPPRAERPLSWFERFKRWLRQYFDGTDEQADSWLRRWLDEFTPSEAVRIALLYGVVILVIWLAVVIVVNEIRASRLGRRKSSKAGGAGDAGDVPSSDMLDLEAALREERPSVVLRMLVATLVKTGRLHGARGLTHGELMTRARFDDSTQRDSFRRVTQLAELEVFSGKALARDDVDEGVRLGRSLNAQLSGAATNAQLSGAAT